MRVLCHILNIYKIILFYISIFIPIFKVSKVSTSNFGLVRLLSLIGGP